MSKNLIIFDADSLCYIGGKENTLQQILEKVDNKIEEILEETKADYYTLLLSKGKYFRHNISKSIDKPEGSYKSNRVYGSQIWVQTIKEYLIAKYNAQHFKGLEADDICAWLLNLDLYLNNLQEGVSIIDRYVPDTSLLISSEEVNKILVAKDKDLIKSIPGRHLNFSKKLDKDNWGMQWIETSEEEASFYELEAMVVGDTSDGVTGLNRKGPAWVKKNFEGKSLNECQHLVFEEYIKEHGDFSKAIYEFQKNWRLLHMLTTDEDMLREVGYIPKLPEFQKVYKTETLIKVDF